MPQYVFAYKSAFQYPVTSDDVKMRFDSQASSSGVEESSSLMGLMPSQKCHHPMSNLKLLLSKQSRVFVCQIKHFPDDDGNNKMFDQKK